MNGVASSQGTGCGYVTGASSGIGAATVRALCAAGWEVHAAARREDLLRELADETGCHVHAVDVCDLAAVEASLDGLTVDLLVNNAGLGRAMGSLVDATSNDVTRTIETNVIATIQLARLVLPGMIERGRGHVVNLGSMAGLYPLPAALYGASKAASQLLSSNLRLELEGTGVRVTEICPGRVRTEFYDVAIDDDADRTRVQSSGIEELEPHDVAEAILYAVSAPPRVNVNRIELQPTEQTYGGSSFVPRRKSEESP